jgi:hypothetical protein
MGLCRQMLLLLAVSAHRMFAEARGSSSGMSPFRRRRWFFAGLVDQSSFHGEKASVNFPIYANSGNYVRISIYSVLRSCLKRFAWQSLNPGGAKTSRSFTGQQNAETNFSYTVAGWLAGWPARGGFTWLFLVIQSLRCAAVCGGLCLVVVGYGRLMRKAVANTCSIHRL